MRKLFLLAILQCLTVAVLHAQEIPYTICKDCWNADSLGNHRVVVEVKAEGTVAKAIIPWRRRDSHPEQKRIIVQDAKSGQKVLNAQVESANREQGIIRFEPTSGKGTYYVYYMPYKNEGKSNYPKGIYLKPENTASAEWISKANNAKAIAAVKAIQSIDEFDSFFPMEVIATEKETNLLVSKFSGKPFIVFPEKRQYSIRMPHDLPYSWVKAGKPATTFIDTTNKGENFTYQLGVYALQNLQDVKIVFSDLKSNGATIAAANMYCINTNGTSYDNKPLVETVNVSSGNVQSIWCGIDIPKNIAGGTYSGTALVTANGMAPVTVNIKLVVTNKTTDNGGIDKPWMMTRLKWLNSTMAQENTVIAPYTALQVVDKSISLLGRKIELDENGLPKQIQTFFTPEMTAVSSSANNILTEPIHFHITKKNGGQEIKLKNNGLQFTQQQAGTVNWKANSSSADMQMDVAASIEFDGFLYYSVKLTALNDIALADIAMHIPFQKSASTYMMGLGQKGGYRPEDFSWKWDVAHKNQDGAWIGSVNAGLQYSLRDEKYVRPLNTNFYLQKPLLLPTSWGNDNKGGVNVAQKGEAILANNYSGERTMKKGDVLYYNFTLLITPFHTINTDFQWENRFYHKYNDLNTIKSTGASIINIHHATPINPWINYPFIEWKAMKNYIDSAHQLGLKVKIYNTVRELSNHAYETFALRSLGHEVYSPGKGGGFSWLQEHIDSDYIAAWFVPEIKDAAIINSGMNRWHNYYVEGMNWLTQNVGIDGIYLDDVAFDRITMKRIKRVLTKDGHPGIIDLHSANQYNKSDGFNNSANLYMEHFPYLNRLWFGEYFDYEKNPADFFLTEVSGIPFGLMGEMLQDGGNAWRGMVYGMTSRMPWTDNSDPRYIWKVWDDFGIKGSEMIGYWSPNCPVKTSNDKVLATVYKKNGSALISIASWADATTDVQLNIDWKALGIDAAKATITAPEIKNFQAGKSFNAQDNITVEKGKGLLLIVK